MGWEILDVVGFTEAVGWGYEFLGDGDGEGDGKREEEQQDEGGNDGDGLSVMIEYNEGGLEVWVVNHETWLPTPDGHITFPDLGAHASLDSPAAADRYFLTVQQRLEGSLRKLLIEEEDGVVVGRLKAVVLSGDASEEGMRGMKRVVESVLEELGFGGGDGLVRDEIEGMYVGAVGAARRGREILMLRDGFEGREREGERGHGEL